MTTTMTTCASADRFIAERTAAEVAADRTFGMDTFTTNALSTGGASAAVRTGSHTQAGNIARLGAWLRARGDARYS